MSANYDSTQVGVPYIRVPELSIVYTTDAKAIITARQDLAVKLADGTLAVLKELPRLDFEVNLATQGNDTVPLVHPTTGQSLGPTVTNNTIMLSILAALRVQQNLQNTQL